MDVSSELPGWRNQTQARAAQVYARARMRLEQTLGIVERSLEALGEARGRKSLVLVTGGLVQDSRLAVFRSVVTQSRRANAAIYSVDARGLTAAASGLQADVGPPSTSWTPARAPASTKRRRPARAARGSRATPVAS